MKRLLTILSLAFCTALVAEAQDIKVNQVGYYPNGQKTATIEQAAFAKKYELRDANGKRVWRGKAVRKAKSPFSQKECEVIDFSAVTTPGEYILTNGKESQRVVIASNALAPVAKAGMQAFYLQRTAEPILEKHAGRFARPAGHPDNRVLVHSSAASAKRPEGTVISSPGGWYDAGDYNKYIVNSAFSIGLMLLSYENCPEYYNAMKLNIPEADNNVPDFLDELMVNLRWMQTMQDPDDGGVYHKLTTPYFEGFVMPSECRQPRYVVKKTTAATLDFAACMALAARVYSQFDEYKDWAEGALRQSLSAYAWAQENPNVYYNQSEMNAQHAPQIFTGEYNDTIVTDEWLWATFELQRCAELAESMDIEEYNASDYVLCGYGCCTAHFQVPVWGDVEGLAIYTKLNDGAQGKLAEAVVKFCDDYLSTTASSCYNTPYGNKRADFGWGSNAEQCSGLGIALLYAHRITGDKKYLEAAAQVADYLLGRNATGYCFVTGFGTKSPKHPHQRLSSADDIDDPLPGFLVGGPNEKMQDRDNCKSYPSDLPDEAYTDDEASYASNEIAINWNASLVAFLAWLDAELGR